MLKKYKKAAIGPKSILNGNKTPNPTNFSNSKSQLYLNKDDIENFAPNEPKPWARATLQHIRPFGKELLIDDPFMSSEHSENDTMVPRTSKPVKSKLGNWNKRDSNILAATCPKIERLSLNDVPPQSEGDLNASITTVESIVGNEKVTKVAHEKDKYSVK